MTLTTFCRCTLYSQATGDQAGEFIGYAHAINMDRQDLSLDELKQLNKVRSNAKRAHSNYDALLALDKRQKLVEERKQEKKERQRSEQQKLRGKSKQNSKVVVLRQERAGKAVSSTEPIELLPERVSPEQMKSQTPILSLQSLESATSNSPPKETRRLIVPKNQTSKRIW